MMYNVYINFYTDGDLGYKPCSFERKLKSYTNRTNVFCETLDDAYKITEMFIDNIIEQTKDNPKHLCDFEIFKALKVELYDVCIQYLCFHDIRKFGDYISISEDIGNMELEILITPQEIEILHRNNDREYIKDVISNVHKPDTRLCDFCSYCRRKLKDRKE